MKAENEATAAQDMQKELQELKLQYKKLKDEHASFHDIANKMIEEKDNEISRLSDDNRNLCQSIQSRPQRWLSLGSYQQKSHIQCL
ncbi:protein GRIP-like isoform X2 [Arachis hypogaea]|uniref:protein GRIP-like isoform X2 n=1 Tax=Arachis hypogaea TaxID=3818 RepID=UPI003B20DF30